MRPYACRAASNASLTLSRSSSSSISRRTYGFDPACCAAWRALSRLGALLLPFNNSLFRFGSFGAAYTREIAHGTARPTLDSAAASAFSTVSAKTNSRPSRSCSGISATSPSFRAGTITRLMPGPLRGQRLLLQAADRQHLAGERHLAGHRHVRGDGLGRVTSEASATAIATPADGPSLGTAPAGTWMWMSWVANQSSGELGREPVQVAAHPGERGLRRLAHHVAELAR